MSSHDPTPDPHNPDTHNPDPQRPEGGLDADQTSEYPTVVYPPEQPPSPHGPSSPYDHRTETADSDADEEWVVQTRRGVRLAIPLAGVIAALLVAAGFWGGATLEKNHRSATTGATALATRFRTARAATGTSTTGTSATAGSSGFPFASGSSDATTGTVSIVNGKTMYVLTTTGSLVKVALTSSTTVTRDAKADPVDLRPGDTVVIDGTTTDGTVSASSVTATAPGVTATSGFAGFTGAGRTSAGDTTSTTAAG